MSCGPFCILQNMRTHCGMLCRVGVFLLDNILYMYISFLASKSFFSYNFHYRYAMHFWQSWMKFLKLPLFPNPYFLSFTLQIFLEAKTQSSNPHKSQRLSFFENKNKNNLISNLSTYQIPSSSGGKISNHVEN